MNEDNTTTTNHPGLRRVFRLILKMLAVVLMILASAWAFGAVYFNGPLGRGDANLVLACIWALGTLVLVSLKRDSRWRLATCFAMVLIPWLFIQASNDRDWKPEWAKTGWAKIEGDTITFHNFRNFDYGSDGSVTERWETRTIQLSNLQGVDYFHDAFGGDRWAHPMLSYDFGPDGHILVSIETRRETRESFSQLGGLFKMFELQYLFGDERDFIRVRTNIRREPVYLYRMNREVEWVRETFLDSVRTLNELKAQPRWYNVVTHNCTTSYWANSSAKRREPLDIRVLINGKLDELLHERGSFVTGDLPFTELRKKSFINKTAEAAHDDPNFSVLIREGLPGI